MRNKLHYNKPQLRSYLVSAPFEVFIAGRGTGKSEGVLAPKTANAYFKTMSRGTGVFIGATYAQLLTRTMPALIAGWEKLGYILGKHFYIGRRPNDQWIKRFKWQGPFRPPLDYKYFVSWYNGAGAHLVSQDRTGSANGITIDWIVGDEAKFLNEEKLKTELYPANRGIIPFFKNNPHHHGITLTSDMPAGTAGRWLLDMESKMDQEAIRKLWAMLKLRYEVKHKKLTTQKARRQREGILSVIEEELNVLRKGLLYYHEASTLENIDALGFDYIKQQMRDTTPFMFNTQILNIRPRRTEEGFYPDFNEEYHGYYCENHHYFDNLLIDYQNPVIDCRSDGDRDDLAPLHIALDHNRRIHSLVIGQVANAEIKAINSLHVLFPLKLKGVLNKFCEYYRYHKRKVVYYWYDHNSVGGPNEFEKHQEVTDYLRKDGWVVIPMYIGAAPGHEIKYIMYDHLFTEDEYYNKIFRVNRENCADLILSVCLAGAEIRKNGFGKEKKTEKNPAFPAVESTHLSDALDILIYGVLESGLDYNQTTESGSTLMAL